MPRSAVFSRLCLKTPSSARERAIFPPGKNGEADDIGFIVDAAGCSQAEKGPLEARSSFQTKPGAQPNEANKMNRAARERSAVSAGG
jgi:hypothetical protein